MVGISHIKKMIKNLPEIPGVYFFHDQNKRVIYIGKAADLKARISSHFSGNFFDRREENKIINTKDISFVECDSEIEALFLESEFIKRYKPRYNIEWMDEKNFLYVRARKDTIPEIRLVRRPIKEKNVIFFGPFTDSTSLRRALKILSRVLPIKYSTRGALRASFLWHDEIVYKIGKKLGLWRKINLFFGGKVRKIIKEFEKEMEKAAENKEFEKAILFRDRIKALKHIRESAIFRSEEKEKIRSDSALLEIKKKLKLKNLPHIIEADDISNIFGKEAVGSMVVFRDGLPFKDNYRRFKIKTVKGIDDYKMISEVLERRFKNKYQVPDLVLIDGGKGQLSVAHDVVGEINKNIDIVAIAKKREELFIYDGDVGKFNMIKLNKDSSALLLVERIRDEAHRFAIIYHRLLRGKKGKQSLLDDVSGIGEKTKKKLMRKFKTINNIKNAPIENLRRVVSKELAIKIKKRLKSNI